MKNTREPMVPDNIACMWSDRRATMGAATQKQTKPKVLLGFKLHTPWVSPRWEIAEEVECMFGILLFATKQHNICLPSTGIGFLGINKGVFWASSQILDAFDFH